MSRIITNFKYTVLCIDDNQNNLYSLNALLSTMKDIQSIEVLSAKEALNTLLSQQIDLILCDVQMPDINGFEFAKMIKSNKKTRDIPIIFVTAVFKSEEFIEQGFEIGAVDYLTKPIDDNQLVNKIRLYLKIFDEKNKAKHSEKRFYDIAQSIGDGIYALDTNNETTFINNKALELLGFKKNELLGKKIHDYIHYKDKENNQILAKDCHVHHSMINGGIYMSDEYLIKKDGSFLSVFLKVTPLYENNNIIGTVAIFRDKTSENLVDKLEQDKKKTQEQIIFSMIEILESRDSYTAGHTKRVAKYCELIAREMHHSEEDIELVKTAAWLHDIGKVSTPDSVLLKPNKLNDEEYKIIQQHLSNGYDILKNIDEYQNIADVMREHHEKYNGTGYPRGLKGDEIKPLSRIMIVADAFDAMTTNRIYKAKKSVKEALNELQELSMVQFHPDVVSVAVIALKDIQIDTDISQNPQTLVEEQRFSHFYKDKLTNLYAIEYMELVLNHYMKTKDMYIYTIELKSFSKYNKKYGWNNGNDFLIRFSKYIKNIFIDSIVFRIEGDDFMVASSVKIKDIDEKLSSFINEKKDIINYTVKETFVKDIINNLDKVKQEV